VAPRAPRDAEGVIRVSLRPRCSQNRRVSISYEWRQGIGAGLVATATEHARAAGCEWLHVDFEDHLTGFYFRSCGFTPTNAGLIALPSPR
jgi:predicted N-acetyltransferase YhbS